MNFVKKKNVYTYEEKKSKFIAYLCPYNEFEKLMSTLKDKHSKARHFVYAYRYLNEFSQIVENSSDDGEPKGTSGRPSLTVLSGAKLINSAVIIVRYFGGIKLGTGGLVRAYGEAVNKAIGEAELFLYEDLIFHELKCSYSALSKVEYLCEKYDILIKEKVFNEEVILSLEATKERFLLLENNLFSNLKLL